MRKALGRTVMEAIVLAPEGLGTLRLAKLTCLLLESSIPAHSGRAGISLTFLNLAISCISHNRPLPCSWLITSGSTNLPQSLWPPSPQPTPPLPSIQLCCEVKDKECTAFSLLTAMASLHKVLMSCFNLTNSTSETKTKEMSMEEGWGSMRIQALGSNRGRASETKTLLTSRLPRWLQSGSSVPPAGSRW